MMTIDITLARAGASTRLIQAAKYAEVLTVGDAAQMTAAEWLRVQNVGWLILRELHLLLLANGRDFYPPLHSTPKRHLEKIAAFLGQEIKRCGECGRPV